ncbi:MAG: hypothetical protein K9N09_00605 [Candidatus Cloacimonetes bacterium]|nr:hypothetical protein [Candidatus Cloacimonadota bacterium]MCF7813670.1 hypothetical protein [Candidatus Cloacimonadota bacterium]MCF7867174.1 hypothetical protein [Candidatus Cloacimonadota bacterium]MCF7882506.1 hypothetical protein [Candidatus Cloacimonadota bacterium]
MKRFFLIVLLVLGMFIISCDLFENEDNENEELSIEISPEESTIAVGEELILEVELEDADDLFAMSVEIVFDAAVLTLPDNPLIIGEDWGNDYISTYVSEIDRINVAIGLINNGDEDELEGEVELFQFKLVGVAEGQTMVNIHNLNLYDEDGDLVEDFDEIEIENAVVIVE